MNFLKNNLTWALVLIVVGVVIGTAYLVIAPQLAPKTQVSLGDGVFKSSVFQGEIASNEAMDKSMPLTNANAELYVYDEVGVWPVHVAGETSRDFIWISADGRIVYMLKSVEPDKAPHLQLMPKSRAKYVMALPAGSIESKSITQSKTVKFEKEFLSSLSETK